MTSSNTTQANNFYPIANATASSNPFVDIFLPRDPNPTDVNYPTQKKWLNTVDETLWMLENFTSAGGIVSAHWIKIGSASLVESLTGNTGGPVFPTNNNINVVGDGTTIEVTGNPPTSTLTISTAGSVASLYTCDTGTATPALGNLNVFGGSGASTVGSGDTITIIAGSPGAFTSITQQVITSSGTYTPTPGMKYCIIECTGGGGGGGGAAATGASEVAAGSGGGGGGTGRGVFSAAAIGASRAVTIGAGGAGGIGFNLGADGGDSTVMGIISGTHGVGGSSSGSHVTITSTAGEGGSGTIRGCAGLTCYGAFLGSSWSVMGGAGGASFFGGSRAPPAIIGTVTQQNGNDAVGFGGGGTGAISAGGGTAANGGAGFDGVVVVTEFI